MKNITRHTGTLHVIERLKNSYYGNPRYLITVDGFTCRTAPDSSIAYEITNYADQTVTATIGSHYGVATIGSVKRV